MLEHRFSSLSAAVVPAVARPRDSICMSETWLTQASRLRLAGVPKTLGLPWQERRRGTLRLAAVAGAGSALICHAGDALLESTTFSKCNLAVSQHCQAGGPPTTLSCVRPRGASISGQIPVHEPHHHRTCPLNDGRGKERRQPGRVHRSCSHQQLHTLDGCYLNGWQHSLSSFRKSMYQRTVMTCHLVLGCLMMTA